MSAFGRLGDRRPARREFLGALGAAASAAIVAAGCGGPPAARAATVAVPLATLPPGARVNVKLGDRPVEVHRTADGEIEARSLLCSHMGCLVQWHESQQIYVCTCHGGRYDDSGRPIQGPPPRPLQQIPVHVESGEQVVVG